MNRRELLKFLSITGCSVPILSALPSFAKAEATPKQKQKMVWILLRGGMDGLSAVPAYDDNNYLRLRPKIALPEDKVIRLDGTFGLHPSLKNMSKWYQQGDLLVVHASGSGYQGRSHFDGQKVAENGLNNIASGTEGWLNRTLATQANSTAIAVGASVPLVLRGPQPVMNWSPSKLPDATEELLHRLENLYDQDELLERRLSEAMMLEDMIDDEMGNKKKKKRKSRFPIAEAAQAGKFLAEPEGPNYVALEAGGWDTHYNQGSDNGALSQRLSDLDKGMLALKQGLGDEWDNTVVVITSEFGRTVAENGTGGTDHGTAGVVFLAGGAVQGKRIITDWPGLAKNQQFEGRDLYPTTDLRSILKAVLHDHMGVSEGDLYDTIFPDSNAIKPLSGLIQTS
jgi:uncharacterized protein (DUF1501 family)